MFLTSRKFMLGLVVLLAVFFITNQASAAIKFHKNPTKNKCSVSVWPSGSYRTYIKPEQTKTLNGSTTIFYTWNNAYIVLGNMSMPKGWTCTFNDCNVLSMTTICKHPKDAAAKEKVFTFEKVKEEDIDKIIDMDPSK